LACGRRPWDFSGPFDGRPLPTVPAIPPLSIVAPMIRRNRHRRRLLRPDRVLGFFKAAVMDAAATTGGWHGSPGP
jgi:hypothetical protein